VSKHVNWHSQFTPYVTCLTNSEI